MPPDRLLAMLLVESVFLPLQSPRVNWRTPGECDQYIPFISTNVSNKYRRYNNLERELDDGYLRWRSTTTDVA